MIHKKPNRGINYFGLTPPIENTLRAGYSFDPLFGEGENYGQNAVGQKGIRQTNLIKNPLLAADGQSPTTFSMAANVIDFGIRAYTINESTDGTGYLDQIFPEVGEALPPRSMNWCLLQKVIPFLQVVDVMVRILTTEGASVIALFEEGKLPVPSSFKGDSEDYWWELAEANSDVFVRRLKFSGAESDTSA